MRQAIVAVAAAAALALGLGATGSSADPGGDHGNNLFGLCTAANNGQGGENGKKNEAPPFAGLDCPDELEHPGGGNGSG